MALEEDLVAHAVRVLAAEEVVEADLVQGRGAGVRREVAADARRAGVGAHHHRHRVPADHPPDAQLHLLVAGELRLLLGRDRVDVARLGQRRQAQVELARALQEPVEDELRPRSPLVPDDRIERLHPVRRLVRVAVGQLALEVAELIEHARLKFTF